MGAYMSYKEISSPTSTVEEGDGGAVYNHNGKHKKRKKKKKD